jgi:glucose-6-phosphate dehydrogenase assembly protein OpcA
MIVDMPATSTQQLNRKLVELREQSGVLAQGRILTFVVVTDDSTNTEEAIESAIEASRQHPCRVIVLVRGAKKAAARLDAQIRVGGDAGASEVIVLRGYGPLASAEACAGMTIPMLLPDAPVVVWWPGQAPPVPAEDPVGRLANRRITDAAVEKNPVRALEQRAASYSGGDTDLAWTRLTLWRALLASALDQPPYDEITSAVVDGEPDSPSTDLLAGWLRSRLSVPVKRTKVGAVGGLHSVRLNRASGPIELIRPDGKLGTLTQPGQPQRLVTLGRRPVRDCLAEELRRLDLDETYEQALRALHDITRGRAPAGARR